VNPCPGRNSKVKKFFKKVKKFGKNLQKGKKEGEIWYFKGSS